LPPKGEILVEVEQYQPGADAVTLRPTQYEFTFDMMTDSDSFELTFDGSENKLFISGEQRIDVTMDGDRIFSGITDSKSPLNTEAEKIVTIRGRDQARWLTGTGAAPRTLAQTTIKRLAREFVEPHSEYISGVSASNTAGRYLLATAKGSKKLAGYKTGLFRGFNKPEENWRIRTGRMKWGILADFCAQIGAHMWFSHFDNNLIISAPDYNQPTIYGDGLYDNGAGQSNMLSVLAFSTTNRNSVYRGRGKGYRTKTVKAAVSGKDVKTKVPVPYIEEVYDTGPPFFYNDDGVLVVRQDKPWDDTESSQRTRLMLRRFLRSKMEKAAAAGLQYSCEVPDHYAKNGDRWLVDTMVPVEDSSNEEYKIMEAMYILSVVYRGDENEKTTTIRPIKSNLWLRDTDGMNPAQYNAHIAGILDY
jgi:prophage tail gpP-like protein